MPFRFARLPEIIFRNGAITELPGLIRKFGEPVVFVTGKSSFIHSAGGARLKQSQEEMGISSHWISVPGEPTPDMIDGPVQTYRKAGIKLVVGIGGGSVVDAGKAISAMLTVKESVKDFLEGVGHLEHPGTKVPFIAVPTTSGTGSEATKNAVISEVGPQGFKKSLRHDHFVPDIALIDPELTIDCPKDLTAASGMDCFTQLTEAFLSDKASEFTDAFALRGLMAIKSSLLKSVNDGNDIEARTGMSFAALCSGICLANAGLGTVHGFASSVGGMFDIPHGLVCGTLMAPANRVTLKVLRNTQPDSPALKKYAQLGKLFLDKEGKADEFYVDGFVEYLYEMASRLDLPGLAGFGLKEADIELICAQTENKNNPVKLGREELMEILAEVIIAE